MGTRHLIAVQSENKYKIAQYGQWDGYPGGQGLTVLSFLQNQQLVENLKNNLNKCRYIKNEKEMESINSKFVTNDVSTVNWFKSFYSRDIGAKILANVANSQDDEILLVDSIEFAGDSLFCEWAYIIDFDKNTFEVYKGFNKEKLSPEDRFHKIKAPSENKNRYEPIKLCASFPLTSLPSKEELILLEEE